MLLLRSSRDPPNPNPLPLSLFLLFYLFFSQKFMINKQNLFSPLRETDSTINDKKNPKTTSSKLNHGEWDMVGLSIVLEGQKSGSSTSVSKNKKVINKTTMIINNNNNKPSPSSPSSSSSSSNFSLYRSFSSVSTVPTQTFLDQCFLCKQKLLPGKDIYMYK